MKTSIINILAVCAGTLALSGCTDWLDMTPTDKLSDKIVWANADYVEQYLNSSYPYINVYGSFGGGESNVGQTEGLTETLKYGSMVPGTNVGFPNIIAFAEGGLKASTAAFHFGGWNDTYNRIRRVNEFLYGLNKFGSSHPDELKQQWIAQARFFRGMLYYELIRRHKNVILYDEDLLAISRDQALSTEEAGWNMVYEDLKFAAATLPPKVAANQTGRLTSGAAYALLSRAMLYAQRWQAARDAAEEVFKLGYELMPGTTAADYAKAFTSAQAGNTEAILEYNYLTSGPNHSWDDLFMPGGDYTTKGGRATPTQEMVESYEKATTGGYPDWTPWHTTTGTTDTPPWDQLEPRFHASVLYNQADWKGRKIEPFIGGKDGWHNFDDGSDVAGRTTTGYYLRKMLDEKHTDYTLKSTQPWIAIRLAEVILNHAEACYMLGDKTSAAADLKRIRNRVGLPDTNPKYTDVLEAIRQERKIELYCEGHHWWDMRRWGLADKKFTGRDLVHGLKIEKQGAEFVYTYVSVDGSHERLFEKKLYRIPLPEEELNGNSAVQQFSEWL